MNKSGPHMQPTQGGHSRGRPTHLVLSVSAAEISGRETERQEEAQSRRLEATLLIPGSLCVARNLAQAFHEITEPLRR